MQHSNAGLLCGFCSHIFLIFHIPFVTSPKHLVILSQHCPHELQGTYCEWKCLIYGHQSVCRFMQIWSVCVHTLWYLSLCQNCISSAIFLSSLQYSEIFLWQFVASFNSCSVIHIGVISKRVISLFSPFSRPFVNTWSSSDATACLLGILLAIFFSFKNCSHTCSLCLLPFN